MHTEGFLRQRQCMLLRFLQLETQKNEDSPPCTEMVNEASCVDQMQEQTRRSGPPGPKRQEQKSSCLCKIIFINNRRDFEFNNSVCCLGFYDRRFRQTRRSSQVERSDLHFAVASGVQTECCLSAQVHV